MFETLSKIEAKIKAVQEKAAEKVAELQASLERIRTAEREGVIERIREGMKAYNITVEELVSPTRQKRKAPHPRKGKKLAAYNPPPGRINGIVYTDGIKEWSGHGRCPQWLVEHMAKKSRTLPECAVGYVDQHRMQA